MDKTKLSMELLRNKKICIFTSVHLAFDVRIFYKEARTLTKTGYDVILIAQHNRNEKVDGVKIIALPKPHNRFQRILGTTFCILKIALKEKADVYHFCDPELLFVGILLKFFTQAKVIYDVFEDVPKQILAKEYIPFYLRPIISKMFAIVEKICFSFFDVVIVAGEDIATHFPFSKKITIVRNFPSLEMVKKVDMKKEREKGKEPIVLIYAGGLTRDRGIKEMVQAVHHLKNNAKLVLVGSFGDFNLERKIKERAGKRVEFVGQVPYEKVFQYLVRADIGLICLHPTPNNINAISVAGGRNNKVFEYMASGLPIVASNFPGWKKIIEGGGYGITVDPLNPKNITKGIEELIKDSEKRRKMGEKGRKDFLEEYNWEREKKKLLRVYEKLYEK